MAQDPQQQPVSKGDFLAYVKSKNPQFKTVDDSTLYSYMSQKYPQVLKQFGVLDSTPAPQQNQSGGVGDFLEKTLSNVPASAAQFGENLISPVTHPIETAQNVGNMASAASNPATVGANPLAQQVGKFFVDRYGDLDKLKQTIQTDPVGFLSDLSTLFTGAGKLAEAGNLGKMAKVASTAAKVTDPLSIPANAMSAAAKTIIPSKLASRMYESAVKPSTTLSDVERARMTSTGLREGIIPTQKGLDKLRSTVEDLNNQVQSKIVDAAKNGETINSNDVVSRLDEIRKFFAETVTPDKYLDEINDLRKQFLDAHGRDIPIDKAQRLKQNTYQILRNKYGELSTASAEAQKALARGIKEEIVAQHPELTALNARESSLLDLQDAIEKAVARTSNREMFPTSSIYTGAAATIASKDLGIGTGAFIARSAWENPTVKAALAIALNKARQRGVVGGTLPPIATGEAALNAR